MAEDKAEQAIDLVKGIVDRAPETIRPRLLLASAMMQAGKTDDAARVLSEAIRKWPLSAEAHLLLAYARLDLSDKRSARDEFSKVLEISVNKEQIVSAHLGTASLYESDGQLSEASVHYEKALEIEPELRSFVMTVQKQLLWRQPTTTPADDSGHAVPNQVRIDSMKGELKKLREGQKSRGGSGND